MPTDPLGYLERVGIERQTMKANGTPTSHYRPYPEQLVAVLAEYVGLPVEQVWRYVTGEITPNAGESRPMDMSKNAPSVGAKTPNPRNENGSKAPNALASGAPVHSAKNAQSITSIPALKPTKHYQHE